MEDYVLNKFAEKTSLETSQNATNGYNAKSLEKTIVCFFADGSEKYTPMTIHAIITFLRTTPDVKVGLLTHNNETRDRVLNSLPSDQRQRVSHKFTSQQPYFSNWNPTQYKLDIQKFAEGDTEAVFWADSDCIFFQDLRPFLHRFVSSDKNFYLAFDHVMQDKEFVRRWEEQRPLSIVPQACLMGFKVPVIPEFFSTWEQIWRDWISPAPFSKYPDPRPHFQGSAFCIEQYAMGMALHSYASQILIFGREIMAIQVPLPSQLQALALAQSGSGSFAVSGNTSGLFSFSGPLFETFSGVYNISGIQNFSGLFSGLENYSGAFSGLENFSGLFSGLGSFSGLENYSGAYSGLFSGLENFSGAFSGLFSGLGEFSGLESYSGAFSGFYGYSGAFSGFENFSGLSNFSGYSGNFSGGQYSGYQLTPLQINGTPTLVFLSTHQSSTSIQDGVILIDKFGGSVLHCYNQTYDLAKNWFDNQHNSGKQ
eukprot:TRINITY_DN134_c0_g1_i1.p1 TRINITY_DN134_c0_g1~~TRINITY_DN134_c0_g1_i1.p1  ORF type:complete len:481 (-),score=189.86 TRINITY_DN134_c0_g1_i1:37-1479(-)